MISTKGSHHSQFVLISVRVEIIIFVYNNISSEVNHPPSVCFTLQHCFTIRCTIYLFCVLVTWLAHSLLTELSALIIFNSIDHPVHALFTVPLIVSFLVTPTLLICLGRLVDTFFLCQCSECFSYFVFEYHLCYNICLLCTKLCEHNILNELLLLI